VPGLAHTRRRMSRPNTPGHANFRCRLSLSRAASARKRERLAATRSIDCTISSGKLTFMRTARRDLSGRSTRKAIASRFCGSVMIASTDEGGGIASPPSRMPSTWKSNASLAMRRASSKVRPAVIQPGKSGKSTPKSLRGSFRSRAMYAVMMSPQLHACLPFDTPQRADRDIPLGMRNGHPARARRMSELPMTAAACYVPPTRPFNRPNDVAAVHANSIYASQLRM